MSVEMLREVEPYNTIDILRRIDSEIDFARGPLQIAILLELGKSNEGLTTRDIAKKLSERSKSVADALRKMILKNIVAKVKNGSGYEVYILTDHGRKLFEDLMKVVKGNGFSMPTPSTAKRGNCITVQDVSLELIKKDYITSAIIAIATSRKRMLSLKEVADAMGLSPQRAQAYLNMYSGKDASIRLFKRIDTTLVGADQEDQAVNPVSRVFKFLGLKTKSDKTFYILTEDGLAVYHKLPFYTKYATSKTAKLLGKLFNTLHPRLVAKKLFRIITAMNIVATVASMLLALPLSTPAISVVILTLSIILTTSMLVLYIATYNL